MNKRSVLKTADASLFQKYDVPAPRYTSYPTVPYWTDSPSQDEWLDSLKRAALKATNSVAFYVHIPYCETLCTFCGCNTTITRDHKLESPYVTRVLRERDLYLEKVPELKERTIRQVHLGGGTPTFLSASELERLAKGLLKDLKIDSVHFEGSIEVDPRRTNRDQLQILKTLGFDRVSLGVQDFDPEVQRLVNRVQPFEMTKAMTDSARELGYRSVNFDLIYGLPKQNLKTMDFMMKKTLELRPDRIALYSFALVPWIKPAQRLFKDEDLPVGAEKRELYENARSHLLNAGYVEIGMDHFALPSDGLANRDNLHRNFMGYSDVRTDILLGLGVSAISETPDCFHQNEKVLPKWEAEIDAGSIATFRGHKLSEQDQRRREQILKLMTRFEVQLENQEQADDVAQFLDEMKLDGLVEVKDQTLRLLERGRPFLRNACLALDSRLRAKAPETRIFSSSV